MTDKSQDTAANVQASTTATAAQNLDVREVTLDVPLKRPNGDLCKVLVRRPNGGALRGLSLFDLMRMDVVAIQTVLPRITEPMIHKHEVQRIDPADLVVLGTEVAAFLAPKAQRAEFPTE